MTRICVGVLAIALLTSCGASGSGSSSALPTLPSVPVSQGQTISVKQAVVNPVPQSGGASSVTITEYDVPSFPSAGGIAVTKDGAAWWQSGPPLNKSGAFMVRMLGSSVEDAMVSSGPLAAVPALEMTVTANGRAWGAFTGQIAFPSNPADIVDPNNAGIFYATSGSTQSGPLLLGPMPVESAPGFLTASFSFLNSIATGPDGNVWFADAAGNFTICPQYVYGCTAGESEYGYYLQNATTNALSSGSTFNLNTSFGPSNITAGPDGYMWLAMPLTTNISQLGFYRSTLSGQTVSQIPLRGVTSVATAVTGPDHALWFTDPGDNLIGRVTAGGSLTTYPVPTKNAGLDGITVGGDSAIWFTEAQASKIGRITTSGQISEYATPTSASSPDQIVGPLSSGCGNAQLWFSEGASGKVAEIVVQT